MCVGNSGPGRMGTISYSSTLNKSVMQALMCNKFYLRKIKKSYKLYNKLNEKAKKDEILFSRKCS